jgi:hypothetical protein
MENLDLGFFAITPIWIRLIVLYCLVGLALSLYEEKRAAGDGIAAAIGGTLLAAALAPVTAVKLLIAKWTTPTT